MYFWNSSQTVIFDLGNLVDDTYTGLWNTTLTASFYNDENSIAPEPASLILPISARKGAEQAASVFSIPSTNATNTISFPQNANRAVFTISAVGQAAEEFWWGNVFSSQVNTFPSLGALYGYSPFREVQLLIDGQLAGVQWPFPIIFTGGVVPGLWRPIVGIDAFDLKEQEIDITPWLGVLCDGNDHTLEIRVAGIIEDGEGSGTLTQSVANDWYVTGKIFIWQDAAGSITTGDAPTIDSSAPRIQTSSAITQSATGANETLEYSIEVNRYICISSVIETQSGSQLETWSQKISFLNDGYYSDFGAVQVTEQKTQGFD